MFIVCNYLDVSRLDAVPDGFVVEECSQYDDALNGYAIICREHRIENVMDWARTNMGAKFPMFEKQLSINKTKAMCFIKAKGKIKSFTEEFVLSCGSLEKFKEAYGIGKVVSVSSDSVHEDSISNDDVEDEVVEATGDSTGMGVADNAADQSNEVVEQSTSGGISVAEKGGLDSAPIQNVGSVVMPIVDTPTESTSAIKETKVTDEKETEVTDAKETIISVVEPAIEEINPNDTDQLRYAAIQKSDEESGCDSAIHKYQQDDIYNSDGSFKGFTEGQVLKLLQHLKELDNRIALDDLDPDYVMTTEEIEMAATYLDSVAPSIFKAFFIREVSNADSEVSRIRISAILNHLATFIASLNK